MIFPSCGNLGHTVDSLKVFVAVPGLVPVGDVEGVFVWKVREINDVAFDTIRVEGCCLFDCCCFFEESICGFRCEKCEGDVEFVLC